MKGHSHKKKRVHGYGDIPNINQRGMGGFGNLFGFNDDDFGFGIEDEFDDPFEKMMGEGFDFPNIGQIHQHLFGNMFGGMGRLGDGLEGNESRGQMTRGTTNNFQSIFSMQGGGPGTMISKSYCSKVDYRDGKPHQECYQSQSINQFDKEGHKISERQEAYKNSNGVQKAAHQRILDDKGTKQIRERNINTGFQEEHNIFKGMKEDELENFNQYYNDYRQKVGFQNNYKYLNALNGGRRGSSQNLVGDGRKVQQNKNIYPQLGDGNIEGEARNNMENIPRPHQKRHAKMNPKNINLNRKTKHK